MPHVFNHTLFSRLNPKRQARVQSLMVSPRALNVLGSRLGNLAAAALTDVQCSCGSGHNTSKSFSSTTCGSSLAGTLDEGVAEESAWSAGWETVLGYLNQGWGARGGSWLRGCGPAGGLWAGEESRGSVCVRAPLSARWPTGVLSYVEPRWSRWSHPCSFNARLSSTEGLSQLPHVIDFSSLNSSLNLVKPSPSEDGLLHFSVGAVGCSQGLSFLLALSPPCVWGSLPSG